MTPSPPRSVPVGDVRPFGDRAFLIGVDDADSGRELVGRLTVALETWMEEGECEVVGGLATVLVMARQVHQAEQMQQVAGEVVGQGTVSAPTREPGRRLTIPCAFDGPDLADVATGADCPPDEVVALFTAQPLSVAMLGFSPGFAFLHGLPAALEAVPRRDRPRTTVPAGSVALANGHAAIYPSASPGGWHLIGRTAEAMFSPSAAPYARLAPGDRVQFEAVDAREVGPVAPWVMPPWQLPGKARHLFTVLSPGLRTVLQDGGRRGVAAMGVPEAGPADPHSFALANRLVGNGPERAALEITGHGPTLRLEGSSYVTVVGATPQVRLDGQTIAPGQVIPVRQGQELGVGAVRPGLRAYLAAAGGFAGPLVLGSAATDQLSGLGAGPLVAGDSLFVGTMRPPLADHLDHLGGGHSEDGSVTLRVVPGPHPEWFESEALERLAASTFVVEPESNRVGLRLRPLGAKPVLRAGTSAGRELDSQAMVHGAVQVPPDGDPVALMPDHATHGGYPVLAVVITADLGRLGQCAAGDRLMFEPIALAEARAERATQRRVFDRAVVGYYPLAVE
jgi:KipI family sensor histidine kinase inhibitor